MGIGAYKCDCAGKQNRQTDISSFYWDSTIGFLICYHYDFLDKFELIVVKHFFLYYVLNFSKFGTDMHSRHSEKPNIILLTLSYLLYDIFIRNIDELNILNM